MKTIVILIGVCIAIMFVPQLIAAVVVGGPIFLFYKIRDMNRRKMTKAQKRKAFLDDIFYY